MKRVLIIEDDKDIVDLLEIHLRDLECVLTAANTGTDGLAKALTEQYDLIVLDIMLPGLDGLEVCRTIRTANNATPILMLTAKSEESDKVLGLELGADDYLTKPFSIKEFIARVKVIFRRGELQHTNAPQPHSAHLVFGTLHIDVDKRKVTIGRKRVELTPKEFDLLLLLASHPGSSFTRARLLNLVWGYDFEGYEHTVNAHINRLRMKIEPDVANPTYILTMWGVGYRFNDELS